MPLRDGILWEKQVHKNADSKFCISLTGECFGTEELGFFLTELFYYLSHSTLYE